MFDDDFEKLVKIIDGQRRTLALVLAILLFWTVGAFVVLVSLTGCARPDMTDREAASIVELLRR